MRFVLILLSMFGMNYYFSTQPFYDYRFLYWHWAVFALFIPAFADEEDREFFAILLDIVYRTLLWFVWGAYLGALFCGWFLLNYCLKIDADWPYIYCFFIAASIGSIFGPSINRAILEEVKRNHYLQLILVASGLYLILIDITCVFSRDPKSWSKRQEEMLGTLGLLILFSPSLWLNHNDQQNLVDAFGEETCVLAIVYEKNEDTQKAIDNEAERFIQNKKPDFTINELGKTQRDFFNANLKLPNIPDVTLLERYKSGVSDTYVSTGTYVAFKGPDPLGKMKNWLEKNGYDHYDFNIDHTLFVKEGETFIPTFNRRFSELELTAYFKYKGRLYLFDGHRFIELGLNKTNSSIKKDGLDNMLVYLKALQRFAL